MVTPKNERICVTYVNAKGKMYVCTTNLLGDMFWLYEVVNDKLVKTKHKSKCPLDFDDVVFGR